MAPTSACFMTGGDYCAVLVESRRATANVTKDPSFVPMAGEPSEGDPHPVSFSRGSYSDGLADYGVGEKPPGKFNCRFCPYSSGNRSHIITHERTHSGEKPFACKLCRRAFARLGDLRTHVRTHTKETPYRCEDCGRHFRYKSSYWRHRKHRLCSARSHE